MEQPTGEGLLRAIRRWDLVALTINCIIGAGIFGLPSEVFARIGVYSLAAFVICGVAVTLIVLCFAEVSSRYRDTGGPYLYARDAFGPLVGFEVGWMMWISRLTAFAANCNLLVSYFGFFVPAAETTFWRAAIITAVVAGLAIVNIVGVRDAANLSNVLTAAKLAPLALFVAVGCFFIEPANFTAGPLPGYTDFSVSVLVLLYAFVGFEMAAIPSGEYLNPGRDLPRGLLQGLVVVLVFYMLIQLVAVGTLPGLGESNRPLSDAAGRFLGPLGAGLITAGAMVSIVGNLHVIMLVAPRLPFAMAERRELPKFIAATHRRFHTPHVAIAGTAAVMLALSLSGTFVYAATISVIARLFGYATTCLAVPMLRRKRDASPASFQVPAGTAVCVIALLLVVWLLSNSTAEQARDSAIAAAIGLLIYGGSKFTNTTRFTSETRDSREGENQGSSR
jgi:amino acid transporter